MAQMLFSMFFSEKDPHLNAIENSSGRGCLEV